MTATAQRDTLRQQARKIGEQGQDIRKRIEALVNTCTGQLKQGSRRLVDIAADVYEGAAAGIAQTAPPDDAQSRLRQVIDGLGDGLTKAANASRLAVEEAAARGQHFARKDMQQLRDDIQSLRDLFVEIVSRTASQAGSTIKSEAGDAKAHARRTYESIRPSLDQALTAIKSDPAMLARETTQAVASASKQAAGALFTAVGNLMHEAADKLQPRSNPAEPANASSAVEDDDTAHRPDGETP